ncbi:YdgA family protein [Pseudomonas plecoglossicida]|uniref:YdgA family protein n=1 Tax=Pseudomonas plecoglossicida TaxID=70775 RepID=UPI00048D4C12|nr:YdgA family protein [Pseudomonas plecoglossicida]GLR38734.1 GTP-binding protein [Pseudomonas plecoglossicida]
MKKSVGILSGLAIAIAVAITAGAWYTGTRLPAELDHSVSVGNAELKKALLGTGGSMTIELAGVEQHFFTSTAQYRLKAKDINLGQGEALNFEVGFTDRIEHGPFPWSRVKALKLMPVMATSNSTLQKDDFTAPWFAATGEQPPVTAQVSLGYGGDVDSKIQLAPFKFSEDNGSSIDFSGLQLEAAGDQDGKASKFHGAAERLDIKVVGDDHPPATLALQGLKIGGNLTATEHDMIYVGNVDLLLAEAKATLGPKQQVLLLKGLEQNALQTLDGPNTVGGRVDYKVSDITWDNRAVGSGQLAVSIKSINAPALQALSQWYQAHLPEFEQAAAAGQPVPQIQMDEAEKAKFQGDLKQLLESKPQLAVENLSFKTANGESRFNLSMDFASPTSFDLPADQMSKQLITQVNSKLSLSKPMMGDLATLQALLEGQIDAQAIAMQSSQAGEMVGMMALQSGMATVQGDDVVSSLHYADGMVDFNGKKMTVEEFAMILAGHFAAMQPQEG